MSLRKLLFFPATLLLLLMSSCGDKAPGEFTVFRTIDAQGWAYDTALSVPVDSVLGMTEQTGTLILSLRHTDQYQFRNIWFEISYRPEDSVVVRDTFNIVLSDNYGRWLGSGSGPSISITDTLSRAYYLPRPTELHLRHIMRPDTVKCIERIGITFIPDNQ